MATEAETTIVEVGLDEIDSDHNERSQLNEENFNDLDEGIELVKSLDTSLASFSIDKLTWHTTQMDSN